MPLTRKPRLAIMGEFSSGKSTLCNVLMGARPLLEKVTATQLPPVWLSYGPEDAYTMGLDGQAYELDLADLERVSLETTEHVRIFMKSDILRYTDLIDMPGISDPSMSPEVWERMAHLADGVLWCTHATQAWRQPGSSFKPFIYSAALEKGFTPVSIVEDEPISFPASGNGVTKAPLMPAPARTRVPAPDGVPPPGQPAAAGRDWRHRSARLSGVAGRRLVRL